MMLQLFWNTRYYTVKKFIILILNVYHKKSIILLYLNLSTLFAFIVIRQLEKWSKINDRCTTNSCKERIDKYSHRSSNSFFDVSFLNDLLFSIYEIILSVPFKFNSI